MMCMSGLSHHETMSLVCSDCRQTQAQHSDSLSECASISLLDVLRQVPTLPEILAPDVQKALSATCKSCRVQFLAQVQVVTVERQEDCALIFERKWPRLIMVILQDTSLFSFVALPPPDVSILKLRVSATPDSQSTIFMLRPMHDLATDLPCVHLAAQQLAHQMRIRWPSMSWFSMCHGEELSCLGLDILSQLVKGTWTCLTHLRLCECELTAEALLLLSQGNWPRLSILDVSGNCLDAEGMALLAKGDWPSLMHLYLSFNPTQNAGAISYLQAANWPVEYLTISDTPVSVDMAAELAGLQLPSLKMLRLTNSVMTTAAVSELARAHWPILENLSFGHDDLHTVAVLLGIDQKNMRKLKNYARNHADVYQRTMISRPDVGLWPDLSWIRISRRFVHLTSQEWLLH